MASSTAFNSASRALTRSPTPRISARSASGTLPLYFASSADVRFRSALRSSASLIRRRRSASRARIVWTSSPPHLSASARATVSGCSRMRRRSSTGRLRGFGRGRTLGFDARDRADAVVGVELDDAHAHRVTALRGDLVGVDADDLALGGDEQDVVTAPDLQHAHHGAVAPGRLDVDDPLAGPPL